jgi:hypothetical protein
MKTITSELGKQEDTLDAFSCSGLDLDSLEGGPRVTKADFFCSRNNLKSLKHGPVSVGGSYRCINNKLTTLEGIAPVITDVLSCRKNNLTWLRNIHKQISEINGQANFKGNPIKSHVLGLLKIKGLKRVELDNEKVQVIVNKYLPQGDIFACQEELEDAGFEEFAKL